MYTRTILTQNQAF